MAKDYIARANICTCGHEAGEHSTSTLEEPPLSYYHRSGLGSGESSDRGLAASTDIGATICWGRHDSCVCKSYVDINEVDPIPPEPQVLDAFYEELVNE